MPDDQATAPIVTIALQAFALTRKFGDLTAVSEVTLTINQGEIFGLIGANGAGKSTLIKMLTTLLPPTSGSATVAGYDIVTQPAEVRRHIGYVPQLLSADGSLTGYENMLLHHLAGQYSGGMIRRLEIAQSFLHRPTVLFLDEPTVGLDPGARETVWEHVLDLRDKFDRTMIVTSHHMDEIDEFCDRIALIDRGRIAAVGTSSELKARVGPNATLDDVFLRLVADTNETETEGNYGEVRRARRAAREHG